MNRADAMHLRILLPTAVLLDAPAVRVVAEARDGAFGMLPRHVDFVAALAAGIFTYETPAGDECHIAVNEGTLVKCGREVMVSTPVAVQGPELADLRTVVAEEFAQMDEHERRARSALTRLEAGALRRFLELEAHERG